MWVSTDPLAVTPVHPTREDGSAISVALAPDGVLVAGGFRTCPAESAPMEMYRDGRWTPLAPLPGPRGSGKGVQARSGRVVLGGRTPVLADSFGVDVYDPTRDVWTRTRPDWAPPEPPESTLAELRAIRAQDGRPPVPSPEPTVATWTSPVAMADGSVVWFVDAAGEFFTSLSTMAWLDPVRLVWSEPVPPISGLVAQLDRPAVGLPDGRLVTTGWSMRAGGHRLFAGPAPTDGARDPTLRCPARRRSPCCRTGKSCSWPREASPWPAYASDESPAPDWGCTYGGYIRLQFASPKVQFLINRGRGTRTRDLRIWNPLLYQLSYTPVPARTDTWPSAVHPIPDLGRHPPRGRYGAVLEGPCRTSRPTGTTSSSMGCSRCRAASSDDDHGMLVDELHFIVVHQTYELWFKLVLRCLRVARDAPRHAPGRRGDASPASSTTSAGSTRSCELGVEPFRVMETITPQDFLDFRDKLVPASGFQSLPAARDGDRPGPRGREPASRYGGVDPIRHIDEAPTTPPPARLARGADRPRPAPSAPSSRCLDEWLSRTPIQGSSPADPGDDGGRDAFLDDYLAPDGRHARRAALDAPPRDAST